MATYKMVPGDVANCGSLLSIPDWPADSTKFLDGGLSWSAPAGGSNHNILSSTHLDATVASVIRGDIIAGIGVTPTWQRLAIGGANTVLHGGTEPSYSAIATGDITNGVVTLAKLADMTTNSLFYRKTAGSGAPEVNTLATLKTDLGLTGTNSGDQTITLTGDVTGSGTGSFVATHVNIPDGVTQAGHILQTNIAAPVSPAAGKVKIFADSTDLRFHDKDASGTVGTTVVADTGASNNFLTAISAAGVISKAQPTEANLSTSDITTNNVSSTKHGFVPKSPADATQFLNGALTPVFALVKDSDLSTSDITTNNYSITKHGFVPKGTNVGNFLKDDGTWAAPAGSGDMVLANIQTVTGAKTFNDLKFLIRNPADTFSYTFTASAIVAARTLTLPLTTQTETLAVQPSTGSATNSNPTGTTSTTGVMAGLAVAFTPRVTGKVFIIISGQATNNTGDDGAKYDIRYGTGVAPANGGALAGTVVGATVTALSVGSTSTTDVLTSPFCHQGIVTGLTIGTAYWIDIGQYAVTGGTATFSSINVSIVEM